MNKLLTKIVGVALGATMAVGVGVAAVKASDGGIQRADAATASVNFIKSGYSFNDGIVTLSGSASSKSGASYWGMYGGASLTTKTSYSIDSTAPVTISMNARTYGTVNAAKHVMTFNILSASDSSVLASKTLTPENKNLNDYSDSIPAINSGTSLSVKFQLVSSSTSSDGQFTGMTSAIFSYSEPSGAPTLSIDKDSAIILKDSTTTITATATGGTGSVSWESTDPSIASVSPASGSTTTVTGVARGSTVVTASYSTAAPVTATIRVADPKHAGTLSDPYTAEDAIDKIDLNNGGLTDVYSTGIVSRITTAYSDKFGNVSFDISTDGLTTSEQLRGYRTVGTTEYPINSADSVQVGDTVILKGNLTKYNTTYELDEGNELVYLSRPAPATVTSIEISGSLSKATYKTTDESWSTSGLTVTATYSDSSTADVTSSVEWSFNPETPALMGATQSGTLEITASYEELTDSIDASVVVNAPVVIDANGTYTMVTDSSSLQDGDIVLITNNAGTKALSTTQNQNNRADTNTGITSGEITIDGETSIQAFALEECTTSGSVSAFAFNTGSGYIYAASSSSNNLKTKEDLDDNGMFSISINSSTGVATIVAQGTNTRNTLQHNSGSNLFACYASASQAAVSLFRKNTGPDDPTKVKTVELDKESASVEINETVTLTATISPNTATTQTASWLTSDSDIATVSSGVVTGVGIGNVTITAYADENGNGQLDAGEKFATCAISVTDSSATVYTLVTSASQLEEGDSVIIAAASANYAISTTQNTNNRGQASIVKDGNDATLTDDVQVFTLEEGTKTGTFAFNTGSGYIYAAGSDKNYLRTEETLDDNGSFTIVITDGVATITAQGENARNIIRYNSSNNPPVFSCYASGQNDVCIYKASSPTPEYTAADFAKELLKQTKGLCNADYDGEDNHDALAAIWSTLSGSNYWGKVSNQSALTGGTADSSVVVPTTDEAIEAMTDTAAIGAALYRYDFCTDKYKLTDFMGRVDGTNRINPINKVNNTVAIVVVVTISLVSVSALGAYFLLRKKKEER